METVTGWLRRWLAPRPKTKRCPLHHSTHREYLTMMRYSTNILCTCRPIHVTPVATEGSGSRDVST